MKTTNLSRPNILPITELRTLLKKRANSDADEKIIMPCWSCEKHPAHDIHHLDGDHSNSTPENLAPYCKRCHNEVHGIDDNLTELGILVRQYYSVQKQRMAMANRIRAYNALGYEVPGAKSVLTELEAMEARIGAVIEKDVEHDPIYAVYLKHIPGIGPILSAAIRIEMVDPGRFNTISKLWAYSGLDVSNDGNDSGGHARKRKKGEKANWNPRLRMLFAKKLTDQFIRLGIGNPALGRRLYDKYKQFYVERDGHVLTKGHIDNRARRKVGKVFAACLWVAWRKLSGLPITEPYAAGIEGHSHIITPEDWVPNWELHSYQYRLDFPGRLPPVEV